MSKQITDAKFSREFVLAGNATLTLVSVKTGTRFTFRVRASNCPIPQGEAGKAAWFVALLNGRDNESDFQFLGTIFEDLLAHDPKDQGGYRHSGKSRVTSEASSVKGFVWAWRYIVRGE